MKLLFKPKNGFDNPHNKFVVARELVHDRQAYMELMGQLTEVKSKEGIIDFYSSVSDYGPIVNLMVSAHAITSKDPMLKSIAVNNISKGLDELLVYDSSNPESMLVKVLSTFPNTRSRLYTANLINPELYDIDEMAFYLRFEDSPDLKLGAIAPVGLKHPEGMARGIGVLSTFLLENAEKYGSNHFLIIETTRVLKYLELKLNSGDL